MDMNIFPGGSLQISSQYSATRLSFGNLGNIYMFIHILEKCKRNTNTNATFYYDLTSSSTHFLRSTQAKELPYEALSI